MRLRKLAGATAGALVFGALSVPISMSPAHAAPVSAETAFSAVCTYASFNVPVSGTLEVTVDGASVDATIDGTANLNANSITTSKLVSELTLDIDGEAVVVDGESTFSPPNPGSTPMPIPAMSGTRTATTAPAAFDVTAAKLIFTITFGTGTAPCTFTDIAPVSFPAPPVVKDLSFLCAFGDNEFAYETDLDLSAKATAGTGIAITAGLEDMPNTAPPMISMPNAQFVGTLGTAVGDLTGTRTGNFQGGVPVAIPALTGSTSGSGGSLAVTVEDFTLGVPSAAISIPCTLEAPKTFTIDVTPKSQPCVAAEAAVPGAQAAHTSATNAAKAEAAGVAAATPQVAAASKAVSKAKSQAKKASAAVKKATKAVKKAKSKAKKAKAKKALTKAKKANTKAKKALTKANGQLKTANAQLATANGKSASANAALAAATAALTAAKDAVAKNC